MHINPTALTISQLLGATNEQYVVPAYQRRFSWREKQVWDMLDDILLISGDDRHLLGSIVCLTGSHVAGINKLELVDGQQRLTTLSILLQCIHERLVQNKQKEEAGEIAGMLTAKALQGKADRKILLDSMDAAEFDRLTKGILSAKPENVNLRSAFHICREWASGQSASDIAAFLYHLKNQCLVIRLDVSEAKDAFKLFETINNRGLRLSSTDIIKNFVLGNAARFGEDSLALARSKWTDLIRSLDAVNADTFFRYFLMAQLKRRVTNSQVISRFKKLFMTRVTEASLLPDRHWYVEDEQPMADIEDDLDDGLQQDEEENETPKTDRVSFATFVDELAQCARVYGQLYRGDTGTAAIDRHLRNLRMIKSVQTYGFLMHLRIGGCSDSTLRKVLRLTEAFMLRRHICKLRANENEKVFAKLCDVDCEDPLPDVVESFREYSPSDDRFLGDFASVQFGGWLLDRARYCLEQLETSAHGAHDELFVGGPDSVHVEHIIPQKIKPKWAKEEFGDWPKYLGQNSEAKHERYVSRIGNLTLFAGPLNIGASNNPYERKKKAYVQSAIQMTKSLPDEYPEFRYAQVDARSSSLAEMAITLWPIP